MKKPQLNPELEFELMADYQVVIESKSVVVENSERDQYRYSLYNVSEPFPTYEEYCHGNEFDEAKVIANSNNLNELKSLQQQRRTEFKSALMLA